MKITEGLSEEIKRVEFNGPYDLDHEDEYYGNGIGCFFKTTRQYRWNWVSTGKLNFRKQPRYTKTTVETWKMLNITIFFANKIAYIHIRLWRLPNDPT